MSEKKQKNPAKAKAPKSGVSFFHSIGGRFMTLISAAVLISVVVVMVLSLPSIEKTMKASIQNYLTSQAEVYGEQLQRMVTANSNTLNRADYLKERFGSPEFKNIGKAYIYIVKGDGTMVYHPTAEKIGQPVENSTIKQLLSDVNAGNEFQPIAIAAYKFDGDTWMTTSSSSFPQASPRPWLPSMRPSTG